MPMMYGFRRAKYLAIKPIDYLNVGLITNPKLIKRIEIINLI